MSSSKKDQTYGKKASPSKREEEFDDGISSEMEALALDENIDEEFLEIFREFARSNKGLGLEESEIESIDEDGKEDEMMRMVYKWLDKKDMTPSMLGISWERGLEEEFEKPYFVLLDMFVRKERRFYPVYPPLAEVFAWSQYCDVEDVKVVIVGQDPSHLPELGHGVSFSSRRPEPPTQSLKNIFAVLEADEDVVPKFKRPSHGNLIGWAKQGVLLLNTAMTVRHRKPGSHMNIKDWKDDRGWQQFTDAIIKLVNEYCDGVVFMLWGYYARKKRYVIDASRHLVLTASHPTYYKNGKTQFVGIKHFSQADKYLGEDRKINWSSLE